MEKYSQEWLLGFKKSLSEKYKYLISFELPKYEIFKVEIDDIEIINDELSFLTIDIHLDFLGSCDGDATSLCNMFERINNDIRRVLLKYHLDKKTLKFSKGSQDFLLNEIVFMKFEYSVDEKHEAHVYTTFDYSIN